MHPYKVLEGNEHAKAESVCMCQSCYEVKELRDISA